MCTLQFDRKNQCIDAAYFVGLWSWLYGRLPLCNKEIEIRNSDGKKSLTHSDLYFRIPFENPHISDVKCSIPRHFLLLASC